MAETTAAPVVCVCVPPVQPPRHTCRRRRAPPWCGQRAARQRRPAARASPWRRPSPPVVATEAEAQVHTAKQQVWGAAIGDGRESACGPGCGSHRHAAPGRSTHVHTTHLPALEHLHAAVTGGVQCEPAAHSKGARGSAELELASTVPGLPNTRRGEVRPAQRVCLGQGAPTCETSASLSTKLDCRRGMVGFLEGCEGFVRGAKG
jgi:hypothetical protein